jgi:peptidoglycan/xylan/chitin deacetylase (PgdA/CDA1 family)
MLNAALTHDVDRIAKSYQYGTHLLRNLKKFNSTGIKRQFQSFFKKDTYWNFEDIMDIEDKYKVKSTFFFLNETINFNPFKPSNWPLSLGRFDVRIPRVMEMIRLLDNQNWEIAVQGSYLSYRDQSLLKQEKKILEEIVGHEILGVRQHYLNVDDNTWNLQRNVGFKYDSSFGYSDKVGFINSKFKPFFPLNDHFVVFPLVIMDGPFMNLGNEKWHFFDKIIEDTQNNDALLVIDWHSNNFSEYDFPGYRETFIEIIQRLIDQGSRFYTLGGYYYKNIESKLNDENTE